MQPSNCLTTFLWMILTTQTLFGELANSFHPTPPQLYAATADPIDPISLRDQSTMVPSYAFYYSPDSQLFVYAGETIQLTTLDPENAGGFIAPVNGGISIPQSGVYAISYSVYTNTKNGVIALAVNGKAIPKTSVANLLNQNTVILRLNTGDILTLINGLLSGPINVLSMTTNTRLPTIPVSLTLQQIGL